MSENGMVERNIPLSQFHDGQAERHQVPNDMVHAIVHHERGDGYVINEWPNRHLSGAVINFRGEDSLKGRRHRRDFVSIDSAMLQVVEVNASAMAEVQLITGDEEGVEPETLGELFELFASYQALGNWLTLSHEDKDDIGSYFGRVASERARARNPLNTEIGRRAARMQDLVENNNPGAVRAMTWPQERSFNDRVRQILNGPIVVNDMRKVRLLKYMLEENSRLAAANAMLNTLAEDPTTEFALADLAGIARRTLFRVQPFNQMAYGIKQAGGVTPEIIETTQDGIQFQRYRNALMKPFRQLTAHSANELYENPAATTDAYRPDINERIAELGEIEIGGPYRRLIDSLQAIAVGASTALYYGNIEAAQHNARNFKWLATYHCFPNDPQVETWYRYQL